MAVVLGRGTADGEMLTQKMKVSFLSSCPPLQKVPLKIISFRHPSLADAAWSISCLSFLPRHSQRRGYGNNSKSSYAFSLFWQYIFGIEPSKLGSVHVLVDGLNETKKLCLSVVSFEMHLRFNRSSEAEVDKYSFWLRQFT